MNGVKKTAIISICSKYRYRLTRVWKPGNSVLFIGLNPSTADANTDDNTVRRCINFAKLWGYGGLTLVNLFAFRTKSPKILFAEPNPVGPRNDDIIIKECAKHELIIACWGASLLAQIRSEYVRQLITKDLHCLKLTKNGNPQHPLYIPGNTKLAIYKRKS